jgi:hypothetical protein
MEDIVLNLTREQCDNLMAPVLQYLLPAMEIRRNFPRALVYNSIKYMGLGIQHPHTIQEILRIKDILCHVHRRSITGKLYRLSLEVLLVELGMGTELSDIPIDIMDTLTTNSLVKSTCQFLQYHELTL